jgi:tetratricopeptide (TPR) repeat protein
MVLAWLLLGPFLAQDGSLSALYAQERFDDVVSAAGERLATDPSDQDALYWCGRAELERARQLLASRGSRVSRTGLDLAHDLADAQLQRAADQLARVQPTDTGLRSDAREWHWFARSLRAEDETLPDELERAWTTGSAPYAAYLRGLLLRDSAPSKAAEWLQRAAETSPGRADFQLAWADALARDGRREAALAAWERAQAAGASRGELSASLLDLLPSADAAPARLERLEKLATGDGGSRDALLAWHRAFALEQLGRPAEAEAVLAAAPEGRTNEIARAHARLLAALDRPHEAQAMLVPLAAAGDDQALEQLVALADDQGRKRRYDDALAAYEAALQIDPIHARATANRALTLARSGGGLEAYRALAAAHADRADLLNDAALAIWGGGQREEARALLERAAALPAGRDARENLASLLLDQQPPDPAAARPLLEAVLDDEPRRDRALYLRHVLTTVRSR